MAFDNADTFIAKVLADPKNIKRAAALGLHDLDVEWDDCEYESGGYTFSFGYEDPKDKKARLARDKKAKARAKRKAAPEENDNDYYGDDEEEIPELPDFRFTIPVSEYPGCCGVAVVHEVGYDQEYLSYPKNTILKRGIGNFLFGCFIEACKLRAKSEGFVAYLTGATTHLQRGGAAMARRAGFRRVSTARKNPNTGNMVTLWWMALT